MADEEGEGIGGGEQEFGDLSHQACYVFQPSGTTPAVNGADNEGDEIDDRPRKKRKTSKRRTREGSAEDVWPVLCSGTEPPSLARLRHETYKKLWKKQEERLDAIACSVDQHALQKIKTFVRTNKPAQNKVTTALLVSDGLEQAGATRQLLQHWHGRENDEEGGGGEGGEIDGRSELLIQLHPAQAPNLQTTLKNLIRLAIQSHSSSHSYTHFLAQHKKLIPINFDLQLLQSYIQKHAISKLIIAIPDVESFDLALLSQLLSQLAAWSDRIPFAVILTIATTVGLLETRLSKSIMRLLDSQIFRLAGKSDQLYHFLSALQCNREARLFVGPAALAVLYDLTQDQTTSAEAFASVFKYIYMSHFFANPLSVLVCSPDHHAILKQADCQRALAEVIRNTPSFQSHCTALLESDPSESTEVRSLLSDDEYTLTYALNNLTPSLTHLQKAHEAISLFINLYNSPMLNLSPISSFDLHIQLAQHLSSPSRPLASSAIYADLISSFRSLPQPTFSALLKSLPCLEPLITTTSSITAVVTCITNLFTRICPPPATSIFSLPEALTYNLRHPLTATFIPRPRYAVERALSQPADYLSCSCCSAISDHPSHPTAMIYSLLADAGRDINVRDLWDTFCRIWLPNLQLSSSHDEPIHANRKDGEKAKAKAGAATSDQNNEESDDGTHSGSDTHGKAKMHALSLFYRALSELKMLGLIKSASNSSSKTKGVDVISKTTWKGL